MADEKIISFDQFLNRFLDYGHHHQLGGSYIGIDEEHLFKFKELTDKIDFNCQFENGLCIRERKGRGIYEFVRGPSPQCCCEHCASYVGHLEYIPSIAIAKEIYKLYDKDVGFWSTSGCKLPRKWRSITCLTYSCGAPRKHLDTDRDIYEILEEGITGVDNYFLKHVVKEGEDHSRGRFGSHCKSDDVYKHLSNRIETEKQL